jgi:hypothetical protein
MGRLARNHGIPSPIKETVGFFSLTKALSQIKPDVVLFSTEEAQNEALCPVMAIKPLLTSKVLR